MIKSTFSRNSTKLPPSCLSKKPSLASLAQKLQDVDLSSTSSLPDDGLKKPSMPFGVTDDGNSILASSGKLAVVVSSNEDRCKNVVDVDGVFSRTSQTVSGCSSLVSATAVCFRQPDENEGVVETCSNNMQKRSGAGLADICGTQNDCSLEFHQLDINPSRKRCRIAKPTPFGLALSAVPDPSVRALRRRQKVVLYTRFSYSRQIAAVAGMCQQLYSANSQAVRPFDFSTPSPDDLVQQKQKMAFGASAK